MIKRLFLLTLLGGVLYLPISCATIVSNSVYPISIKSTPPGANIVIVNKKGAEVYKGKTPAKLELDASEDFFSKAHYEVTFTKEGYVSKTVPITASLDSWYFGNIVFGGFIGFLIVDPLTGAMYKIDKEFINVTLLPQGIKSVSINKNLLPIFAINDIPKAWEPYLVKIN